jgi:hypothetical protein
MSEIQQEFVGQIEQAAAVLSLMVEEAENDDMGLEEHTGDD